MLLASGAAVSNKTLTIAQRDINCDSSYRATRLMFEAAEKQGVEYKDELFKSVVLGKTEDALRLLKASEGHAENLPFYAAAYCGVELFAELVSQGFDAETQDSKDCDSLQIAAAAGNLEIVKYLVENGASLDFSDYRYIDYDPLKASIINDHYDVTKYLLEKGAKFNINKEVGFDGERYYPMDRPSDSIQGAVINGNQEMLTLMWEHGYPNDDNTDARGLESAIYYDKPDILEYFFIKGADPNPDESLLTVEDSMVDACASFGTIHLLKILDKHGSNMNLSNTHALISAVFSFNVEIVKYLLSEKMPVDTVYTYEDGSHGDTAWHEATRHGYFEIIKLLVEHGADVTDEQTDYIVDNGGESHNILKYLIDNGADVNRQDKEGNTALMMAAKYNRAENAKLLLKSGADTKLKNKEGKTALDIAKEAGAKNVEKIINGA
jgi:ankyrin repeat protein